MGYMPLLLGIWLKVQVTYFNAIVHILLSILFFHLDEECKSIDRVILQIVLIYVSVMPFLLCTFNPQYRI